MFASNEYGVIYPVTIIKVKSVKCWALLDTSSGSSNASKH